MVREAGANHPLFEDVHRNTIPYVRLGIKHDAFVLPTFVFRNWMCYHPRMNLSTPVSQLSRVGKTSGERLARLGIETAQDLLYYFPFRYEDYSQIVAIKDLREGETVTVEGQLELIANRRSPRQRKNITEALVSDATGSVRVVWFNQPFLTKSLHVGDTIFLSGTVKGDMLGPEFVSPAYEKAVSGATTNTARLVPIYSATYGITQKQVRFLIKQVLPLASELKEWLPEEVMQENKLIRLPDALTGIHFPDDEVHLKQSTDRLKFDELFLLQLQAERTRLYNNSVAAPLLSFKEKEIKEFVAALPFTLTATQKISAWEILQDIAKPHPMNRLLSGDVGSGKTVVAALASFNAVLNGYQAVLMAPTEILAKQHYDSIVKLLKNTDLKVGLFTRSQKMIHDKNINDNQISKQKLIEKIQDGSVNIIIGTHALLSENIEFSKLGLVVVDEQHRFGVEQRKIIKEKGSGAHFLSMTATPIPRSLALVIYGDLEISIISELPPGRKKIITRVVEPMNRQKAYDFIRSQIKEGRQAFVICPLIEGQGERGKGKGGENNLTPISNIQYPISSDKKSVMSEYEKLSKKIFPDLKVGYLHGKLKPVEKEAAMAKFKIGELDVLVSTSVVEVGVDIPNASVMMIEGAEQFGLAQLHQFRGRVGRSSHQSYCLLFTESDATRGLERLRYFETTNDGFKLAEKDLEMRGPGEVYGMEQSGMMQLRLAKLTDQEILKKARAAARELVPRLNKYPAVIDKLSQWEKTVHLE